MQIGQTLRDSWHNVKHLKGSAWGGFAFVMLANILLILAASVLSLVFTPGEGPGGFLSLVLKVLGDFIVLPIVVAWSLLAVYKLRSESFSAQRCFELFKWPLMWRFYVNMLFFGLVAGACIAVVALIFFLLFPDRISEAAMDTHIGSIADTILIIFAALIVSVVSCMMHFSNMLIAEGGSLISSIKKSSCAVIKNYPKIFCIIIAITFFSAIAFLIAWLVMALITLFAPHIAGLIIGCIVFILPMVWILPWSLSVWGVMYRDLFSA